jgi:uncharacterized membrane protein
MKMTHDAGAAKPDAEHGIRSGPEAASSGPMAQGGMSLWTQGVLMLLGAWLIASPAALAYGSAALTWSDIASGLLVILFATIAVFRGGAWPAWGSVFVGTWLVFAPLLFWAPTSASYLNDTLLGVLIVGFAILIPHGMAMPGPDAPPGWSYSPSTWLQRTPMIALGFAGFYLSRYMTAYQLGHIPTAWDPFFGTGTEQVLTSTVARAFPISDAGLGATVYLVEAMMGLMGDRRRWRTMPWMVTFFGILVVPLGIVSIILVILQPVVVGAWCTICLIAAMTTLLMIPLTLDEVVAMGQFLMRSRRAGKSVWRTFWLGGEEPDDENDTRSPGFGASPARLVPAMVWGMTWHKTLLLSAALGGWLMFSYTVLPTPDALFKVNAIVGALAVTVAVTALAEVGHAIRFLNILLGAAIILMPWLFGSGPAVIVNNLVVGALLVALSIPRGTIHESYGSWERYIR